MHEWSVASSALSSIIPMQAVELLHGSKRGKMRKTMSRVFHVSIESAIHPRNSDCVASKHLNYSPCLQLITSRNWWGRFIHMTQMVA